MFTYTTPSKKDFEFTSPRLLLPEELEAKLERLLKVDVTFGRNCMKELKLDVVSDKAFGYDPTEHIVIEYTGICTVQRGTKQVRGRIRVIAEKVKYLGYYERL